MHNESRLDSLLHKMEHETNPLTTIELQPKTLQFGSLIEQHMGALDLKKEMEKLKELDE